MKAPLLSIIVPVYNAAKTIDKLLESMQNHKTRDVEVILINDGSSDESQDILEKYCEQHKTFKLYNKANGGPSSARNLGIQHARGKYITFADADDSYTEGGLQQLLNRVEQEPADMLVFGWRINKEIDGLVIHDHKVVRPKAHKLRGRKDILEYSLRSLAGAGEFYNLWNKVFRADLIANNSILFDEGLDFGEDLLFVLKYAECAESVAIFSETTYLYTAGSTTSTFGKSSLVPSNRIVNSTVLEQYVGTPRNAKISDLTTAVQWRWLLSYAMLVCASASTRKQKLLLLKERPSIGLKLLMSPRYVGAKQWLIYNVFYFANLSSYAVYFSGSILASARRLLLKRKTTVR